MVKSVNFVTKYSKRFIVSHRKKRLLKGGSIIESGTETSSVFPKLIEHAMAETTIASFGPSYKEVEVGKIRMLGTDEPLALDCGKEIEHFPIAYQTYGTLNEKKNNAILVCHGLTGDQYLAGTHPVTGKPGWWNAITGPGKILDTNKYYIICSNVLGGCMGSFGPKSLKPKMKKAYNLEFPILTISDMVRAQKLLIESLDIPDLLSVIGGSMGGMLALEWAAKFPNQVYSAVPIATGARHTAQNIAFHEIGRQAIMADPNWCQGSYIEKTRFPDKGLAIARMAAHVTYMSDASLHRKFSRGLQDRDRFTYSFEADFQVESYLRHQGFTFVDRFDANSYLYITRAMDYYDLAAEYDDVLAHAFEGIQTRFCVMSFSSDWLFNSNEARYVVHALNAAGAKVSFVEIDTDKGHDAFLLNEPEFFGTLEGFLSQMAEERNI